MLEESTRDRLRSFLARLLGWGDASAVDRALRSVELAVAQHAPLVLCGDGNLVPVAHALHQRALGPGSPFVLAERRDRTASSRAPVRYASGVAAFEAATDGTLCVRSKRPPRDFPKVMKLLRGTGARVRLVVCSATRDEHDVLLAIADPIHVPELKTRAAGELPRIVDECAAEAMTTLSWPVSLTPRDRDWVVARCASSLHEIEVATLRMLALRHAGSIARAAELLGMSHAALGEWFSRRRTKRT